MHKSTSRIGLFFVPDYHFPDVPFGGKVFIRSTSLIEGKDAINDWPQQVMRYRCIHGFEGRSPPDKNPAHSRQPMQRIDAERASKQCEDKRCLGVPGTGCK